jgi:2-haloacid dehalogenase
MPVSSLSDVSVCIFDAYGTLFDVNAAARALSAEIGPSWKPLASLWRQKQLEYSWIRSLTGHYVDFRQITADALDHAIEAAAVDRRHAARLMALYDQLDAYPEVFNVLTHLRDEGYKIGILSNGSPQMLASATENAGISHLLDAVLSVDKLGYFKPLPSVYHMVVEEFSILPQQVLFFSSNGWDINGAAAFGLQTVWVNRFNLPHERLSHRPDHVVQDLSQAILLLSA